MAEYPVTWYIPSHHLYWLSIGYKFVLAFQKISVRLNTWSVRDASEHTDRQTDIRVHCTLYRYACRDISQRISSTVHRKRSGGPRNAEVDLIMQVRVLRLNKHLVWTDDNESPVVNHDDDDDEGEFHQNTPHGDHSKTPCPPGRHAAADGKRWRIISMRDGCSFSNRALSQTMHITRQSVELVDKCAWSMADKTHHNAVRKRLKHLQWVSCYTPRPSIRPSVRPSRLNAWPYDPPNRNNPVIKSTHQIVTFPQIPPPGPVPVPWWITLSIRPSSRRLLSWQSCASLMSSTKPEIQARHIAAPSKEDRVTSRCNMH